MPSPALSRVLRRLTTRCAALLGRTPRRSRRSAALRGFPRHKPDRFDSAVFVEGRGLSTARGPGNGAALRSGRFDEPIVGITSSAADVIPRPVVDVRARRRQTGAETGLLRDQPSWAGECTALVVQLADRPKKLPPVGS